MCNFLAGDLIVLTWQAKGKFGPTERNNKFISLNTFNLASLTSRDILQPTSTLLQHPVQHF